MTFYLPERAPLQKRSVIDVIDIKTLSATDTMGSDILSRLHAYWRDKARSGGLPARSAIAPMEIASLLPCVILVDIHREPFELVYRLVGNTVIRVVGRELKGSRVQDLPLARAAAFSDAYALTARDGLPRRIDAVLQGAGQDRLKIDRLVMPLSGDGQRPDMLFIAADHAKIR